MSRDWAEQANLIVKSRIVHFFQFFSHFFNFLFQPQIDQQLNDSINSNKRSVSWTMVPDDDPHNQNRSLISEKTEEDEEKTKLKIRRAQSQKIQRQGSTAKRQPLTTKLLTMAQINLIRQVWNQLYTIKGPTVIGQHVFQRLFFKSPGSRDVFWTMDLGERYSNHDQLMKWHSKIVSETIDNTVDVQ